MVQIHSPRPVLLEPQFTDARSSLSAWSRVGRSKVQSNSVRPLQMPVLHWFTLHLLFKSDDLCTDVYQTQSMVRCAEATFGCDEEPRNTSDRQPQLTCSLSQRIPCGRERCLSRHVDYIRPDLTQRGLPRPNARVWCSPDSVDTRCAGFTVKVLVVFRGPDLVPCPFSLRGGKSNYAILRASMYRRPFARRRIFFRGTRVWQLFLSAHCPSHLLWRATTISPVTVFARRALPLNGVTRSAASLH